MTGGQIEGDPADQGFRRPGQGPGALRGLQERVIPQKEGAGHRREAQKAGRRSDVVRGATGCGCQARVRDAQDGGPACTRPRRPHKPQEDPEIVPYEGPDRAKKYEILDNPLQQGASKADGAGQILGGGHVIRVVRGVRMVLLLQRRRRVRPRVAGIPV